MKALVICSLALMGSVAFAAADSGNLKLDLQCEGFKDDSGLRLNGPPVEITGDMQSEELTVLTPAMPHGGSAHSVVVHFQGSKPGENQYEVYDYTSNDGETSVRVITSQGYLNSATVSMGISTAICFDKNAPTGG